MTDKNRKEYDVAGIGSALLDLTVEVNDAFLSKLGLRKGEMQLIDEARSREILDTISGMAMSVTPGGSAANTVAGVASLGGRGMLFGRVGRDSHGDVYVGDTERSGVVSHISRDPGMTGHAITFITPDSERTFATHLGAALRFAADDLLEDEIARSRILHMEGYLFEPQGLRDACMRAISMARAHGVMVSVDLSDPGLIGRIKDTFSEVVSRHADIVFVNEDEARAYTGSDREQALAALARECRIAVVKIGAEGSLVAQDGKSFRIDARKTSVVNTNGAGDMYAAGLLYGISRGWDPERAGRLASYVSSLVVAQVGARLDEKVDPEKI